jgi:multiple sugar transport system permease protein
MNGIGYKIKKTILYILLILLSVVCMFPFLLMIVNATRSGSEIMKSFTLIPSVYLKENWATVFKYFNLFLGMWNSLKVAVPSTLLCAYFSAMTAYALAMYKFKGNKVLFMTILIFMMIPGQLGLIGFYNLCTKLHLVNSYIPLIIPAIASPGTVFFLRQYVLSVMPPSLIEAARIDGSGEFHTFNNIVLPLMKPAIAVQAIFTFVSSWNNYFVPALILHNDKKKTLPILIAQLRAADWLKFDMGQVYVMIAFSIFPVIIIYLILSRHIVQGVALGSVKG